jgi:hypothetical protein
LPARVLPTFFPSPGSMLAIAPRAGFNLIAISSKLPAIFKEKPPISGKNAAFSHEIEPIS